MRASSIVLISLVYSIYQLCMAVVVLLWYAVMAVLKAMSSNVEKNLEDKIECKEKMK